MELAKIKPLEIKLSDLSRKEKQRLIQVYLREERKEKGRCAKCGTDLRLENIKPLKKSLRHWSKEEKERYIRRKQKLPSLCSKCSSKNKEYMYSKKFKKNGIQ